MRFHSYGKKIIRSFLACSCAAMMFAPACFDGNKAFGQDYADRVFTNAKVFSIAFDGTETRAEAVAVKDGKLNPFSVTLGDLTDDERTIILKGCLINYYAG